MVEVEIIYSDDDLIVVNKPPGLPVPGGPRVTGKTLVDFLLEKFPEIKNVGDDPLVRPGLVHRLDKDTSGVMVVARNQRSFEYLKNLFKTRRVEKTYWAIVCGRPEEREGVISLPIGRLVKNPLKRGVEIIHHSKRPDRHSERSEESRGGSFRGGVRGAREAVTEYRVLDDHWQPVRQQRPGRSLSPGSRTSELDIYSLVELKPRTGRMHQIRVHLKAIGHPVACDKLYGGKNVCCPPFAKATAGKPEFLTAGAPAGAPAVQDSKTSRHLLHAKSISFSFPEGRKLSFEADPPEDFAIADDKIV